MSYSKLSTSTTQRRTVRCVCSLNSCAPEAQARASTPELGKDCRASWTPNDTKLATQAKARSRDEVFTASHYLIPRRAGLSAVIHPFWLILSLHCTTSVLPGYCADDHLSTLRPFPWGSCDLERCR